MGPGRRFPDGVGNTSEEIGPSHLLMEGLQLPFQLLDSGRKTLPLLLLLIGNGVVAQSSMLGQVLLAGQLGVYALGCCALLFPRVSSWRPARLVGFFLLVNASMLVAWGHHLSGRRAVIWDPTRR